MRFSYEMKHQALELNLTPLIDVFFFLNVFFLITASFVQLSGVTVQLPELKSSENLNRAQIMVSIDQEGKYFFKSKEVDMNFLNEAFSQKDHILQLTIRADKQAAFESVMRVWDLARQKGLKEVVVLSSQEMKG